MIKAFKTHLKRLGYSQSTVQMLPSCVDDFMKFCCKNISQIEAADITQYYEYLKERPNKRRYGGLSESFIHHHIYALKLFFSFQLDKGTILTNPISSLSFPSPKSISREILSIKEINALYLVCETYLDRAILSLFYGCGLRRNEAVLLDLKDVHFRSGLLYVRQGKWHKRRVVPTSETVKNDLKNYVYEERKANIYASSFTINRIGKRMRGNSYSYHLKKLLKRANIHKDITLHSLRHSIASHLLESGLSVEYVRDFLGHKHLESTQVYTHIQNKQLWNL